MTRAPEVWRPIPGWTALYEVSSHGRVRSLDRIDRLGRLHRGRVLKYSARKSGDIRVNLYRCGKLHRAYVARLVALTFLDEGEPGQRAMPSRLFAIMHRGVLAWRHALAPRIPLAARGSKY